MKLPAGYSSTQIALHWAVALLVLTQFLVSDTMSMAFRALREGTLTATPGLATAHVIGGFLILAFVIGRLILRRTRGAPPPPPQESAPLRFLAAATHGFLYLTLIALVATGAYAWFTVNAEAGEVHEVLKAVLLVLIGLHVLGVLYNQFVLKTDILRRMTRPS